MCLIGFVLALGLACVQADDPFMQHVTITDIKVSPAATSQPNLNSVISPCKGLVSAD